MKHTIRYARTRSRRYNGGTVRTWERSHRMHIGFPPSVRAGVYIRP